MSNIWKRSLSMLLALVMVFGMLPVNAIAVDTEGTSENHTHEHVAAVTDPTCTEGGYTTYTCACGDTYTADETEAAGHAWGEWVVTTEATVESEGVETRTCGSCGATETQPVAKLEGETTDPVAEVQALIDALPTEVGSEEEAIALEEQIAAVEDAMVELGNDGCALLDLANYEAATAAVAAFWEQDYSKDELAERKLVYPTDGSNIGFELYLETDGETYTFEVKDGKVKASYLYAALKIAIGEPTAAGGLETLYSKGYKVNGSVVVSSGSSDIKLNNSQNTVYKTIGTQYKVQTKYDSGTTINVKVYHEIALTLTGDTTADCYVSYNGAKYTNGTIKVYSGDSVTVSCPDTHNCEITEGSTTASASGNLKINFTKKGAPKHEVKLNVVNSEFGTASLDKSGEVEEGSIVTLTATPATSNDSSVAYYVKSVSVEGATLTDNKFTVGKSEVTVTVTFEKLDSKENPAIEVNGYALANKAEGLKEKVLAAVIGENVTSSEYKVEMAASVLGQTAYLDVTSEINIVSIAGAMDIGQSETFRITYKDVSIIVSVKVNESRPTAVIKVPTEALTVSFDSASEVEAAVKDAVEASCGEKDVTGNLKFSANAKISEDKDGEEQTIVYTVTLDGTAEYVGGEKTVTVKATGKVHAPVVTIQEKPDNGEAAVSVENNVATVVVTPNEGGYYVESVTYTLNNGTAVTVEDNNEGTAFNGTFTAENGNAGAENTYVVTVSYGKREIALKDEIADVFFDGAKSYEEQKDRILKAVFDAAVADSAYYDEFTITCKEKIPAIGKNTFEIVWKENGKYTSTSVEVEINLVESRPSVTIGEIGELTVGADEYNVEYIESKIGEALSVNGATFTTDLDVLPELKQGDTKVLEITVNVADTESYAATQLPAKITVIGKVEPASVETVSAGNGTIAYSAENDTFTLKPEGGYVIDKLVIEDVTGETATVVGEYGFDKFENGVIEVELADGTGMALGVQPKYKATASFAAVSIVIKDTAELTYYVGMENVDLNAEVLESVNPVYTPDALDNGDTVVWYKAREAATYPYEVSVNLPIIGTQPIEIEIPAAELWLNIGDGIPTNMQKPTSEDIQNIFADVLETYSITKLMQMSSDELGALFGEELKKNEAFINYFTYYGAHEFGAQETELVKLTVESDTYGKVESNTATLTLIDNRTATSIKLNQGVSLTYGFTEADLRTALAPTLYAGETTIDGTITLLTPVDEMHAGENVKVQFSYAGNNAYKPCTAETTITINKAPVDVFVDNRLLQWEEGLTYDMPVGTDPAGVDTIKFMVGLDVSDMNFDSTTSSIVGLNTEIILMIPDALQDVLNVVGISNGVSMTLSQLKEALLTYSGVLDLTNSSNETVTTLLNMLESLPTETLDVTVRVGGGLPTDVGVYLVGAVSADADYETDFGVGGIVIYPDGHKADLAWLNDDTNGIVHQDVLKAVPDYLDVQVTKVYEGNIADAQKEVITLFFGVDTNGEIVITADASALKVGAYTEIGMISNFGNEMYYAEPIVRGIVIVPETVKVEFIDENGNVNADRHFVYDGTAHEMDVRVTSTENGVLVDTTKAGDENLTITYIGLQSNAETYNSTTPPTRTGAYTVLATYLVKDGEEIKLFGAAVGAMVIEPAESSVETNNKLHQYDGKPVTTTDMVKGVSTVPGETPTTTVITAALATDGTFSENALAAIDGIVNVDFPVWLDKYLKQIDGLSDAYTAEGLDISVFYEYADDLEALLAEAGIETDMVTRLVETLKQMPNDVRLTFLEQADVAPYAVGTYLVVGIVTDPDHYPSVGAALLIIYPELVKADLEWRYEDSNNIFKLETLTKKIVDLGADAYLDGALDEALTQQTKILYLGVDAENWEIKLYDDQTELTIGAYTEIAYLLQLDSTTYYAEPLIRTFIVAPETVTVQFVDENGNPNDDRLFTFNGEKHPMHVIVTDGSEELANTIKGNVDNLTLTYVGVQANGSLYKSASAPSHAGTYQAIAVYTTYDEEGRLAQFGMAVGVMVIEPAEASIDVESKIVKYGETVKASDLIDVDSPVENDVPSTTVITAQIATDGTFSENGLSALQGKVNIDFPAWLDEILAEIPVLNDGYEEGLSGDTFVKNAQLVEQELAELGIESEIITRIVDLVEQMPEGIVLTFKDDVEFSAVGAYLVVGVVTDSDYYPAMDAGILVITPNVETAELEWKNVDENNIFYLKTLTDGYLDAKAIIDGAEDAAVDPAELYLGVDAKNWTIVLTNEQPSNVGIYTEIATLVDIDSNTHLALPIIRPVIIVDGIYDVLFYDETGTVNHDRVFTYDGAPKSIGKAYIYGQDIWEDQISAEDDLTILYVGTDSTGDGWCRTTPPTDAGVYTVIATYTDYDADGNVIGGGAGVGTMIIKKADLALDMVDTTVTYDGKEHFIDVTSNAASPDYLTLIVDKENNTANIILEDETSVLAGLLKTVLEEALGYELSGEIDVTEFQQAIHKALDTIQDVELPEEIAAIVDKLPAEMQEAIGELKQNVLKPVLEELNSTLEQLQSIIPQSGKIVINGELPANAGEYEFYGIAISKNYEPEATQGILTIKPAEVTVTMDSFTVNVGDAMPELTYSVDGVIGDDDLGLTVTPSCEAKDTSAAGEYTITAAVDWTNPNYTVTVVDGTLTVKEVESDDDDKDDDDKDEGEKQYPVIFPDEDENIIPKDEIHINGKPEDITDGILASYGEYFLATSYLYHNKDVSIFAHENYPDHMYVWEITLTDTDGDGAVDTYVAKRVDELDDILRYKGTSIRVNFTSNGIRFFTAINEAKRSELINGTLLDGKLEGYKLIEYGTVFGWSNGKTYENYVLKGDKNTSYAYKTGTLDQIFERKAGDIWYTGMLVDLGDSKELLESDFLARPYMILERTNADGTTDTVTLYGGQIQRSIYYVACQNRDYWATGSAYDNYLENIIATVENS